MLPVQTALPWWTTWKIASPILHWADPTHHPMCKLLC